MTLMSALRTVILVFGLTFPVTYMAAQIGKYNPKDVVQFTGKVVTADELGDVIPLPYTTINIEGTNRGAISEIDGYFSFVALKGEKIIFSRIGYKDVEYVVPDTLSSSFCSWIQIMTQDNYLLPEVLIFPWPSKEHFKQEFFAIDITNELREKAQENLAQEVLADMRYTVPSDGREATNMYLKQQAKAFQYSGQYKPQRIFDLMAWKQFIEAWKRGDFKSKDKKKK